MPNLDVGDIPMHYQEAGHGPPLVLLHGIGGSIEDWDSQIPFFSRRHRVIAPDLRGFGQTPRGRRAMSVEQMADDVWALLQALRIQRFHLLGYSMGGAVALQLALDHPGVVERLIISNSVPTFQPRTLRQHFEVAYRLAVMAILGPKPLAAIGAERMFPGADQAALRERSTARGQRNTRASYLSALSNLVRWSVVERLGELRMPVLVLAAEHDYFSREDTVGFAHVLPHRRLHVFHGTHHGLPQEAPQAFNERVEKFLRETGS